MKICQSIKLVRLMEYGVKKSWGFMMIIFMFSACNIFSQNNEKSQNNSKNQPKVDIKVNKQYDDKGNVIGYDSTYSYSFSDTLKSGHDTIMSRSFKFPNGSFNYSVKPLSPDSLLKQNPFSNFNFNTDPFNQMNKMMEEMNNMQQQLQQQMQQNMVPIQPQIPNQNIVPPIQPKHEKKVNPEKKIQPKPQPKPEPEDTSGVKINVI